MRRLANGIVHDPLPLLVEVGPCARSLHAAAANFGKPWFFIYTQSGRATRLLFALKFVD